MEEHGSLPIHLKSIHLNVYFVGYNKLLQIQDTHSDKDINIQSEASWFMKIGICAFDKYLAC